MMRSSVLPFIPVIEPFLDKACNEGLDNTAWIRSFAITRAGPGSAVTDWYVSGMHLCIREWSAQLLHLVCSLFPQISTLTINTGYTLALSCPFDELVDSLRRFFALQVVTFVAPNNLLNIGNELDADKLEAVIIEYTSRISQQVSSIEAFFIERFQNNCDWYLQGWLTVQRGVAEICTVGTLEQKEAPSRKCGIIRGTEICYPTRPPPIHPNSPFYI
ncbi:hypothetical protein BT96DRAFT_265600 [Gymnopus androsaceus JB14]|uniref:Uncharacterized protein n=1 Tax=Gymnopus androsaceus JB14 TaxID=1447944 RepID=A0A6A4H660_9AGAR|nr:hypothetical protein BT96DRAFT_265600 [Gymnopus androsaceus JB14]